MANKTVYPFGTGGQLPSNIGIVNDLTTGGADKALSAEMGKDIGDELFGANVDVEVQKLGTLNSYMAVSRGGGNSNSTRYITNIYPITAGKTYKIHVPAGNSAFYFLGYTDYAELKDKSYYSDAHVFEFVDTVGTIASFDYTIQSADNYPCLMVSYDSNAGEPTVETPVQAEAKVVKTTNQNFSTAEKSQACDNIGAASKDDVEEELYYTEPKNVAWVDNMLAVVSTNNYFRGNISGWRCSLPILLYAGEKVIITTINNSSYVFCPIAKVSGENAKIVNSYGFEVLVNYIAGSGEHTYEYTATEDTWISICGTTSCTYSFDNLVQRSRISRLESQVSITSPRLQSSRVMFFGASNTANSTTGIVGFPELIANAAGVEYRAFKSDGAEGNTADVVATYPNITNYAKDGTCLRVLSGRTDGVLLRVKRHITASDYPNYAVVMFPANDASYQNIGTISDSYTATYDTDTQLGALEELCRYITTLGVPIKFGCIIPWEIKWVPSDFYNPYITVLQKWRIPYIDLRKVAGFDVKNIQAQSDLFTLSSSTYAAFDIAATYNLDDKVRYNGYLYKCNDDGVTGIYPTDTTYWMQVTPAGSSDGTHLNNLGNQIVVGKILSFIESL